MTVWGTVYHLKHYKVLCDLKGLWMRCPWYVLSFLVLNLCSLPLLNKGKCWYLQCRFSSQNVKGNWGKPLLGHELFVENVSAAAFVLSVCLTPFTSVQTECSSMYCLLTLCSYTEPEHCIITELCLAFTEIITHFANSMSLRGCNALRHCNDQGNHVNKTLRSCGIENIHKELSLKIHFGHHKKILCMISCCVFLLLKVIKIQSCLSKAHF